MYSIEDSSSCKSYPWHTVGGQHPTVCLSAGQGKKKKKTWLGRDLLK